MGDTLYDLGMVRDPCAVPPRNRSAGTQPPRRQRFAEPAGRTGPGALSQRSASERRSVLLAACHAQVEDIDGNDVDLGSFAGKVVCVVNVATE